MKALKLYILFVVFAINIAPMCAQYGQVENIDIVKKKIKLHALEIVSLYENVCGVKSDYEEYDFLRLFSDGNVLVVNDIIPDNKLNQQIPAYKYKEKRDSFLGQGFFVTVKPYAVNFISFYETSLTGSLWVDALKVIQSADINTGRMYLDTFDIRMQMRFNYGDDSYKISDISLNTNRGKYAILDFYVKDIFRSAKRVKGPVLLNDQPIRTDEDSFYLIKDVFDSSNNKLTLVTGEGNISKKLPFADVEQAANNYGYERNIVKLTFKPPFWVGGLTYSFTPAKTTLVHTRQDYGIKISKGSANSAGAVLGIVAYKWRSGYWQVKTGLSYTRINYNLFLKQHTESYETTDPDNTVYERTNTLTYVKENQTLSYFSVPVIIEKGIYLPHNFKLVFQAGGSLLFGINGSYTTTANAQYTGYYKDFFEMQISENGVYDFGKFSVNKFNGNLNTRNTMMALTAYVGISHKITKKIHFDAGFSYLNSFGYLYRHSNSKLSPNSNEVNSLTDLYSRFKMRFYTITTGIKWIF